MRLIDNQAARRIFLDRHALAEPATGRAGPADILELVHRLGFVQVDSVNTVARAHDMILWSRRRAYRPATLRRLTERDRSLFEHWTHDAAIIPTAFIGHWRWRMARDLPRLHASYRKWQGAEFEDHLDAALAHIRAHGPAVGGDLAPERGKGQEPGWWNWHPGKAALEFLWRTGPLAVCRRDGFAKVYDLAERVYPDAPAMEDGGAIHWAMSAALDRLGFATTGELAAFWGGITPAEAARWAEAALHRGEVAPVRIEGADGTARRALARPDPADAPEPRGLRILSPFDPALRDRNRAERLFGFRYRIEIFVPEAKRQYGYYVFPILEDDRLIGRLDARARRAEGVLHVTGLWLERGIRPAKSRLSRIEAQLARLARFAQCEQVTFAQGWQKW